MAKIGKKPTDDQLLEGGGAGAGMGRYKASPKKSYDPDSEAEKIAAVALGAPVAATGVALAADRLSKNKTPYDELPKKESPKKDSMTTGEKEAVQEAKDAAMQGKKDKAYNAAKTYPDNFAKGGMTASRRGDGIAQRGKTRGTIIR